MVLRDFGRGVRLRAAVARAAGAGSRHRRVVGAAPIRCDRYGPEYGARVLVPEVGAPHRDAEESTPYLDTAIGIVSTLGHVHLLRRRVLA
jgi:hypothetical protein